MLAELSITSASSKPGNSESLSREGESPGGRWPQHQNGVEGGARGPWDSCFWCVCRSWVLGWEQAFQVSGSEVRGPHSQGALFHLHSVALLPRDKDAAARCDQKGALQMLSCTGL